MSFTFSSSPQVIWLYQYDVDGAFIGSVFMHVPANMGLPANTTNIPCKPEPGETGVFNGEYWEYVKDIRGTQYWNIHGNGFVISSLQESLPEWAVIHAPPEKKPGCVLLFNEDSWIQIVDRTGQAFYESNGSKHIVPDAYYTLPEGCTFIAPPDDRPSFATQWNGSEWVYVKDLRGQVAYSTATKEATVITEVGPLPDGYTLRVPGRFDEWDGKAWVKNDATELAYIIELGERQKANLLASASEQIAVLTYAIDKNMATESEKVKLAQWEEYRLVLNRVDITEADISWPEKP
ncbi:tail fiber assembly protein [Serratia fonticola]|uniref:tail fiber assembly protein n=1 Tax=Serratia fonticola TaxID=47917 RepID=UPI001AE984F2|nr:tail fiber assembly protein [Serratia fonticola]MBP1034371.1 tail fiber assembly protein [Serratia fonticola]